MSIRVFRSMCVASVVLIICSAAQGNLLVNGDFEAGNTGFTTSYQFQPVPHVELPEGDYGITVNPTNLHWATVSYGDHTSGEGLMMMGNGKSTPDSLVWSQTVNVAQETTLSFSMWVSRWVDIAYPPPEFEVFINGAQIGSSYVPPPPSGLWSQFSADWDSGTDSTAEVEIRLASSHGLGNDFALDDLVLTPEPGSVMLLGVGAMIIGMLRRYQRDN